MVDLFGTAVKNKASIKIFDALFGTLTAIKAGNKIKGDSAEIISLLQIPDNPKNREQTADKYYDTYLNFRTINSENKDVFIGDVYHPLKVKSLKNGQITEINDANVLPNRKITCLIGKAGQGKTTLLRKIALKEILKGDRVPLIIFLRNVSWSDDVNPIKIIKDELTSLGIVASNEVVNHLLVNNKILPLYDGFDEVSSENRKLALNLIQDTYTRYNSNCFVTTRPRTEVITLLSSSLNYEVCDLNKVDVVKMIKCNETQAEKYRNELLSVIEESPKVLDILITPIIVDIFISTYYSMDEVPEDSIGIYKELFNILAKKHDKYKLLTRESQSGLNNAKLFEIFCYSSFVLIMDNKVERQSESYLEKVFSSSSSDMGLDDQSGMSFHDIVDKTSLIIPDGLSFSYIHKSVMEYHAADFISNCEESIKNSIYDNLYDKPNAMLENMLGYLYRIDRDCLLSFFVNKSVDFICKYKEEIHNNDFKLTSSFLKPFLGHKTIEVCGIRRNLMIGFVALL
ncbi:NACHT domain-containing protein [Photobacterium galatheae]|uniref:NACHT domain-containing protein n=1 Tax=Photobacterium galatheae TaxID=1654360 RepID=UPI00202CCFC9|nr:NACHT domain-containing protein [Photobacterium galatheae]MCM0148923.1 NACHT domain-containing protein [Photobacterium galatheae]